MPRFRQHDPQRLRQAIGLAMLVPATLSAQGHAPAAATAAPLPPAAAFDSTRQIAPGVMYRFGLDPAGPWRYHVLRIDRRRADLALRHVRANDQLRSRERTSSMATRVATGGTPVIAAVNADFFDLKSGENENNQVVNGEWWKGLKVTDSPFDTFDNVHSQLAIDADGRLSMGRYALDGTVWAHGVATPLLTVNANPSGTPEGTALYTARYGASAPRDTTRVTAEVVLQRMGTVGDTLMFIRRGSVRTASGTAIPADGAVIAAYGARAAALTAMADGDTVRVLLTTTPRLPSGRAPTLLIGGWPQIVRDGVNVAPTTATVEGTISRNAEVRHPRTAVAFSKDGRTLWLYVVDGRSTASAGMTLTELADRLLALGAYQALNFDGGGSTTLVLNGRVMNTPSDPTGEREVGNALLLVKRP